jgi:hypothetical protein
MTVVNGRNPNDLSLIGYFAEAGTRVGDPVICPFDKLDIKVELLY